MLFYGKLIHNQLLLFSSLMTTNLKSGLRALSECDCDSDKIFKCLVLSTFNDTILALFASHIYITSKINQLCFCWKNKIMNCFLCQKCKLFGLFCTSTSIVTRHSVWVCCLVLGDVPAYSWLLVWYVVSYRVRRWIFMTCQKEH